MSAVTEAAGLENPDGSASVALGLESERLGGEVGGLAAASWSEAAARGEEQDAAELVAGAGGGPVGPLAPTAPLEQLPALRGLLGRLDLVLGWTRLVRWEPNRADTRLLAPIDLYAARRLAILVPLAGGASGVEAGTARALDPWSPHLADIGPEGLTALIAWAEPSAGLRDLLAAGELPAGDGPAALHAERFNHAPVLAPAEIGSLAADFAAALRGEEGAAYREAVSELALRWRSIWAEHGPAQPGWPAYREALAALERTLGGLDPDVRLDEGSSAAAAARRLFVRGALNPELAARRPARPGAREASSPSRLRRPVFVLGPPLAGAEQLATALATAPRVWHLDPASDPVPEMPALQAEKRGWDSDRLAGVDAMPQVAERFRKLAGERIRDRHGNPPPDGAAGLRMIHGSVANALRVPFLARAMSDATFVFVYRDPRESLAAAVEQWRSGERSLHPELPEWSGPPWTLPLTPEWRQLAGRPLPEIAAEQWSMLVRIAVGDLEQLPGERWAITDHRALREDAGTELARLAAFADLEWDPADPRLEGAGFDDPGDPDPEAIAEVAGLLPRVEVSAARAREWLAGAPDSADGGGGEERGSGSGRGGRAAAGGHPLRSVNTASLQRVLEQLNVTLLISTYQSGRLVAVRRGREGINSHFRSFDSPMGLATHRNRLAVGTRSQVFEYQNVPAVAAKIEPLGSHDGCYVPRRSHFTGDIRIHEIGYAGDQLWIVNTRFSCLATLDGDHSFVPRWRPPFVSAYAAEDRCHLNGMAIVDEQVRYVSALGRSDVAGGWRENKAAGGLLMHVPSGEVITEGLSMPHSPRWYRDRLWVLESGEGGIGYVDLDTGKVETVAKLPGFTRGLAFAGPLAFVGLSEVRESMTFGGLPITGRLEERECGVWIVNIETGETVGFLRFEGAVQEIFAVELLRGLRFPEIVEHGSQIVSQAFVLPDAALAESAPTSPGGEGGAGERDVPYG